MSDDPLDALLGGDSQPLRAWLSAAGVDVEALWELPRWNTAGDPLPHRRTPEDLNERVAQVLAPAYAAVGGQPRGTSRLVAYLHFECDSAWQVSHHYPPIWATLRGAGTVWSDRAASASGEPVDAGERAAVAALLVLVEALDLKIQVENALTSGLTREATRLSGAAARQAREAGRLGAGLAGHDPVLAGYVGAWGRSSAGYDDAFERAAYGLAELLDGAGTGALDEAVAALGRAEEAQRPAPGEYESEDLSELRALRFSLTELRTAQDKEWLRVDAGRVTYLYPFGLRGRSADEAVRMAGAAAVDWDLCGVAPAAVHQRFTLDDVWDGSDPQRRRFDGVQILLPDVTLRAPTGGEPLATLRAELRVSQLGNHYLRLEGELVDADPQQVYTALFRAAPEHGRIEVTCGDGSRTWPRVADFAIDLVEALADRLGAVLSARPGMFQVLVDVYAASLGTGPAATRRREVQSAAQLVEAVGAAVLFHPVPNMVNTIADWIRYPDPDLGQAIRGATNQRDHVVLRTCNTTVQIALGLAHWSLGTAGTVAEFAASLEGLFTGWLDELDRYRRWVRQVPDATGEETAEQLRERVRSLRGEQIRLHKFVTETRSTLALIESPALVASPVVAEQLVTMVRAAGTRGRAADLERKAEEVLDDRLGQSIEMLARQRAERDEAESRQRDRRQRARLNTMLAVVAAVGFSGLGQIFQQGYAWKGAALTWYIICVVVALALTVGLVVGLMSDRTGKRDDDPTGGGGDRA